MAGDTLEFPTWEVITELAQCHTDSGSLLLLLHKYPFASLRKERMLTESLDPLLLCWSSSLSQLFYEHRDVLTPLQHLIPHRQLPDRGNQEGAAPQL